MKFDIEKLTGYRDEDGEIFVSLTDVQKAISTANTDSDRRMTNAEKLAKDTARLSEIIADSASNGCSMCSLHGLGICSICKCPMEIEAWLEREAERLLGIPSSNIVANLKGRQSHTKGITWCYVEEV